MWSTIIAVFGVFILVADCHQIGITSSLNVSVFYETLCPDSIRFIAEQFGPTYKAIGNDMQVDLVPYGFETKTRETNGSYTFKCQHGPRECYGNKVHGCAIALYSVEESSEFVDCSMSSQDPVSEVTLKQCALKSDIQWDSIEKCLSSGQADKILLQMGAKTEELQPKFIPTIVFNDVYNDTLQNAAMTDLLGVVCKLLDFEPEPCNGIFQRIVYNEDVIVKTV